jgi:hypothetical protein
MVSVVMVLGACASGVTRLDGAMNTAPKVDPVVRSVNVWLSDDAKKLVADNLKFNQDTLRSTVERSLQAQNMLKSDAGQKLDVEVTGFRVRSAFTAIMFGFMAGNDNIEGIVTVSDGTGKVMKRAKVSASYALGGIGGGQDESRMAWLYEEFTKHTVAELSGVSVK